MIDLNIIERGDIPADWLLGLKQYASVADDAQDMLLQSLLARAVMRVQEMADKSLAHSVNGRPMRRMGLGFIKV